ncbi:MAG: sigma-70 family RNA polymerase sigma factor [Solirubrobacterales bacterium]
MASRFFGNLYEAARAGCLKNLRSSGCSEEEAEEFFGEAVVEVIDEVDPIARDFDPPQMVNYLKTASRRCLIDDWRHRGVLPMIDLSKVESVNDGGRSIDEEAASREAIDALQDALSSLPKRDRLVFCLRHLRGMSPDEIQRREGISSRTYRKLIQRANTKVRARLEQGRDV